MKVKDSYLYVAASAPEVLLSSSAAVSIDKILKKKMAELYDAEFEGDSEKVESLNEEIKKYKTMWSVGERYETNF